ncbi:hypothetical protein [Nocardioides zeae]
MHDQAARCLADDHRSRRRQGSPDPARARRKAAVEVGMMFVNVGVTVVVSCLLVGDVGYRNAALGGLVSGIGAALGVVALRAYVPARSGRGARPSPTSPRTPTAGGTWAVSSWRQW